MSDSTLETCLHCAITVQGQYYHLIDLGPELIDFVEKSHACMDISKDILCERCFSVFLKQVVVDDTKARYSHCHVCQCSIRQKRRHTLPSGPERDELAARIYPRVIPSDGFVCFNCWADARRNVRASGASSSGPHQGAPNQPKCIDCECILSSKQFQVLMEGPEKDIIATKILPRQIPETSLVCYNCWRKVKYSMTSGARVIEVDTNQSSASNTVPLAEPEESWCVKCRKPLNGKQSHSLLEPSVVRKEIEATIFPREVEYDSRACHACWIAADRSAKRKKLPNKNDEWTLQNFKRTAESASQCFVPGCKNTERLTIPKDLRKKLITKYKIYATKNARICTAHKNLQNYDSLELLPFHKRFTKIQVEEMLLLNTNTDLCT